MRSTGGSPKRAISPGVSGSSGSSSRPPTTSAKKRSTNADAPGGSVPTVRGQVVHGAG